MGHAKTILLLPVVKSHGNFNVKVDVIDPEEKFKMKKEKLANLHFKKKAKLTKKRTLKTLLRCHLDMFRVLKQNSYFEIFLCTKCQKIKRCN